MAETIIAVLFGIFLIATLIWCLSLDVHFIQIKRDLDRIDSCAKAIIFSHMNCRNDGTPQNGSQTGRAEE